MASESLPVGFRFHPTDEELVDHYLKLKILGMDSHVDIIPEVEICKWEPWDLPVFSVMQTDEPEWFFFCPPDYKYPTSRRCNRATEAGYWKPTGNDRKIKARANKELIGTKKTLVFYRGRAPLSVRTNWVMHEYRAAIASLPNNKAYTICRLKRNTDENAGPDFPTEPNSNGGVINLEDLLSDMEPLAGDPSYQASNIVSDIGYYQVEEPMPEEDPPVWSLLNETTLTSPDHDFLSETEQGPQLNLPFVNGFNNSCGNTLFQGDSSEPDDDVSRFLNTLIVDQDELSGERNSAVDRGNLDHGSIGKLSARPQSPLRGVYGYYGSGSSSDTDSEVIRVQYSQVQKASSLTGVLAGSKERTQSPMARRQSAASINQHRRENKISLHGESRGFATSKSVKLDENVSNTGTLQASIKLSSSKSKPTEKPVSAEAKERAEYVSATDLLHKKDSIKESKKGYEVSPKGNVKPSTKSIWNGPVGSKQKGSIGSPETAAVSHEQSSSPDYLVNLLAALLLFVIVIAVMVLDINLKVSKPLQ